MIYFGDGLTDVPCMKLVHSNGGCSIAVYGVNSESAKEAAEGLLRDDRVDYCEVANYMENGSLDQLVKQVQQKRKDFAKTQQQLQTVELDYLFMHETHALIDAELVEVGEKFYLPILRDLWKGKVSTKVLEAKF